VSFGLCASSILCALCQLLAASAESIKTLLSANNLIRIDFIALQCVFYSRRTIFAHNRSVRSLIVRIIAHQLLQLQCHYRSLFLHSANHKLPQAMSLNWCGELESYMRLPRGGARSRRIKRIWLGVNRRPPSSIDLSSVYTLASLSPLLYSLLDECSMSVASKYSVVTRGAICVIHMHLSRRVLSWCLHGVARFPYSVVATCTTLSNRFLRLECFVRSTTSCLCD